MATQASQSAIYYPERDGKPMGETDAHIKAIIDTISVLSEYLRSHPNVLVGGNMMMYYEEGNPHRSMSPDTFVVFGVPNYSRRIYKLWEEGVPPTVVFEFTSRSTRNDDLTTRMDLYARLGIQEYVLLDPLKEYLEPSLRGYRLVGGRYEPLEMDEAGWVTSNALGLRLRHEGMRLRFVDAATGEPLLWHDEMAERARAEAEARRQAEVTARTEAEARRQAEAQLAELQAELARLRNASSS